MNLKPSCLPIFLLAIGCHRAPVPHGALVGVLDSVVGRDQRLDCDVGSTIGEDGWLRGCMLFNHDTLVYAYLDSAEQVVSVGRQWDLPTREGLVAEWGRLDSAYERQMGRGSECKRPRGEAWEILDSRWRTPTRSISLVAISPNRDLRDQPYFRLDFTLSAGSG